MMRSAIPVCALLLAAACGAALGQEVRWVQRASTGPSPRDEFGMAYDQARHETVLFGGWSGDGPFPEYLGDTWVWDGTIWSERAVPGPSPRYGHAMAYDSARRITVLFGGKIPAGSVGETWEWDGSAWAQRMVPGPSPRFWGSMVYDSARARMVLYGGGNSETWEWDGASWLQRASTGPVSNILNAMAYDSRRRRVVLQSGFGVSAETWEYDGLGWNRVATTGPLLFAPAMAYDPIRAVCAIFGEDTQGHTRQQWEWDGTNWNQRDLPGPSARFAHGMVFDPGRSAVVLFGGEHNPPFYNDTWELSIACYANCDSSSAPPILNLADFVCFLNKFAAGDPSANCDGSTEAPAVNVADFICFLNQFAAGCP